MSGLVNKRYYLVVGVIACALVVAGICVGVSSCAKREDIENGQKKEETLKNTAANRTEDKEEQLEEAQQKDGSETENKKTETQSNQLKTQEDNTKQETGSTLDEWYDEGGEEETKSNEMENEGATLSTGKTDEYSDRKWSPFR